MSGWRACPPMRAEMIQWTQPLFEGEGAELRRIREASAYFSDIGWRRHPDDRAMGAMGQVLTAPFAGADHRARALIATSIFHRYSGDEDFPRDLILAGLLDKDDEKRALRLGLAWRFAFSLSASAVGELGHYQLAHDPGQDRAGGSHPARGHCRRSGAKAPGRAGRSL